MRSSTASDPLDPPDTPDGFGKSVRWLRFWFDASVRDIGDLWAPRPDVPGFFRVEYSEPESTPFPTGGQVMRWTMLHDIPGMWANLEAGSTAPITPVERNAFERFLKQSRDA
jgi:hypothetical protein